MIGEWVHCYAPRHGLDDVRGSSAIIAKTDAVFFLKQERDEEGLPSLCTLIQRKARHTAEAKPRTLRMEAGWTARLHSFHWQTTDAQPAPPTTGRPSTIFAQAMGTATRVLTETPGLTTKTLVRRLMDQGVARTTAQRVAESIASAQNAQNPMIWSSGQGNEGDPALPLTDK